MLAVVLAAATEGAEQTRELPMPPVLFGLIALSVFAAALAVTWMFRANSTKH